MKKNDEILEKYNLGVKIDLGCGENKQPGFLGIDYRPLAGVDIVHDIEVFPYPLPDECATTIVASHILEHVNPHKGGFIKVMNELWRLLKPGGQLILSVPYAGSASYYQDPTHCLKENSEVLTRNGFKKIKDVSIGEYVLTKNLETGGSEWEKVIEVINSPYEGEMLNFSHQRMDITVTPNHDMLWGTWKHQNLRKGRADEFPTCGRIGESSIIDWNGDDCDTISIDIVDPLENDPHKFNADDFMSLLGWIISEGCFFERGDQKYISIYQGSVCNKDNYDEIESLVKRMGFKYYSYDKKIDIISSNLYNHLSDIGNQDVRFIPSVYKNLSKRLLGCLLETAILGDGEEMSNSDGFIYTSISKQLADDINEIAIKIGYRSIIRLREGKYFTSVNGKTYLRKDQYRVSITNDNPVFYPEPVKIQYKGNIECVTTEKNHTIMVRQNGYTLWTGNCNPITEITLDYFDPLGVASRGTLYPIYKPLPWEVKTTFFQTNAYLEAVMVKRLIDVSYNVDPEYLKILTPKKNEKK